MNKEKLIQFLLDREIDVEASKTELFENEPIFRENMVSTTDYAVNRVINYLRERLERERQPFTLRNIAPHLVGMEKNSAICSLVER
ncbi:hypothetical protein KJ996_01115, partial [Patescibacteria group bacterium]|nr:hypothetical protein [Patescibacteria group bacterium]